jgi:hypothetical protein
VRVALWTPAPVAGWAAALVAELGRELAVVVVSSEPGAPTGADLDLYHVMGTPAHGFVYRALVRRPGIVLLGEWQLHALVHAETAGRGEPQAYRREARRAHGDTGEFVARQVLAGRGGALSALLAMNQRVLDQSLALVTLTEELRARAAPLLAGRRALFLPLDRLAAPAASRELCAAAAAALLALVRETAPGAEAQRALLAARAAQERSPLGSALAELRWSARELGLAELPAGAESVVAPLFGSRP